MRVENQTPLAVHLIRNAEDGDRMSSVLLGALTCSIGRASLTLAEEQRPIELDPTLPHPHDGIWMKERAASVCVTGFVYPPEKGATEAEASVQVGDRAVRVVALGSRVWREGIGGGLTPTSPRPFERIAMTWDHAFGGRTTRPWTTIEQDGEELIVPGGEAEFPHNPDGMGFYLGSEQAREKPLPMLEDPDARISGIDDFPRPRCFAPYSTRGGMRAELILDEEGSIRREDVPRLASRAAPALTFERLEPGTPVAVRGMRAGGEPLRFALPSAPFGVRVAVGPDALEVDATLDAVDIDAESATVRFLFRAAFDYDLVRYDERSIVVFPRESLASLRS